MTPGRQLGLFGDGPPGGDPPPSGKRRGAGVDPAEVAAEDAAAATRVPPSIRLGTSSWAFPGWAGLVYARAYGAAKLSKEGLAAYSRHPLLRTVGLDRTHYQPMTAPQLAAHAAQVPEDFRFLVKAHEWCTLARFPEHPRYGARRGQPNPHFLDPAYATAEVVGPLLEGLGPRAGPLLFQVAPQAMSRLGGGDAFLDALHDFLSALPKGPLYAIELRNRELLRDRYRALLDDTGAVHCINAHPRMPDPAEQAARVDAHSRRALVVRWMLHPGLDYEGAVARYEPFDRLVDEDPPTRGAVADLALDAAGLGREAFVIVNNKAEGSSPLSVSRLARAIAARAG